MEALKCFKNFMIFCWSFFCMFWLTCTVAYGEQRSNVLTIVAAVWLTLFAIANITDKK